MNGRIAIVALTTSVLAAGIVAGATGAQAQPSCTAWASMPARVALAGSPVTIRMTLHGSPGCHVKGVDNGATATLRGPGQDDPHRWSRLGSADTQSFQLGADRLGNYHLVHGDIQIYDSKDERVPSSWRATTITVKRAAKMHGVRRADGVVSGHVRAYGNEGWRAQRGAVAVLEQRIGTAWRPVVRERATNSGRFVFSGLKRDAHYRVVTEPTSSTWAATSRRV